MQVGKHAVVTIDYTLRNPEGGIVDTSTGPDREPLPYIHGTGSLIPGLEESLEGMNAGERVQVTVPPEKGYGVRDERLVAVYPRSAFGNVDVKVGAQFRTQTAGGVHSVVTITKIEGDKVTVDGNHPLAGIPLSFDVTIRDVRAATPEELSHGHVHGAGGHHH
jgi:FKBP-type peptidyl-prolyl cis-trans isomerase SlyD